MNNNMGMGGMGGMQMNAGMGMGMNTYQPQMGAGQNPFDAFMPG